MQTMPSNLRAKLHGSSSCVVCMQIVDNLNQQEIVSHINAVRETDDDDERADAAAAAIKYDRLLSIGNILRVR